MTTRVDGEVATLQVVERFNAAVDAKDVDALRAAITDDCVFESPRPPDGRRYVGEEMVDVFAEFFALEGEASFETEEIFVAGDRAVVHWLHRWLRPGDNGHVRGIDVFTVRGDRIAAKLSYVKG
ncbi:nuclear transport factor 2 family protein [Nocardioides sp. HM23]|uniref:nuclear transport factor 2 family protein n=1 Tax=Nocardioides bizhenqiangii TaxID=3095076 RepID=UPI002ACA16C7|nr:nuclear transport factor 2 family protein [Nocardioides sp. HM23]MDZ5623550.1 nuclear transport factor 2 family protein [Nocardioides sp. HM23]